MAGLSRRALLVGGAGAGVVALAGCGSGSSPSPKHAAPSTLPPRSAPTSGATGPGPSSADRSTTPPSASDWATLARSLAGRLVRPGAADYRVDRELYDFRFDGVHPAGIAYCATETDVARCLGFAASHGITPTPRGGGHSYAGYSTSSGLVVDVTRMAGVTLGGSGQATVGAGARLIDMYSALNAQGVSVPAGSCPTVGIAGLAQGGGIGVVCRAEGLTSDSIVSARVVTADGRIVTASAAENADLYWGLRGGGGGNFGVVTSFVFRTFPTVPVTTFEFHWPGAAMAAVLGAWQAWVVGTPDPMWSNCLLYAQPGSGCVVQVSGVYLGPPSEASGLLAGLLRATGAPRDRYLGSIPFAQAMYVEAGCAGLSQAACHLPTQNPAGVLTRSPSLAKSELLTGPLGDVGIGVLVDAVNARQAAGRGGAVAFDALGGAAGRPAADATAWVHRDCVLGIQYSVPLSPGESAAESAADTAWLDGIYRGIRPLVSGQSYQNYIDPDLPDWATAYYGANLPRLEQLRRKWDPDGLFRFAQVIPGA